MRRALLMLLFAMPLLAQTRLASDFEIAQMEQQLARSRDFESQLSGRLNLGDARASRNEQSLARAEYTRALQIAERERLDARRDSSMTRYANATSYAALAQAKLRREVESFALLEESLRYTADDPETWNLYASAMRTLGHPKKAVAAARNAVAIASTKEDALDLAVYQYALATSLFDAKESAEAEQLLVTITTALRSSKFADLQREVARGESFEVYSSARGDVAAYVSLLNRAQLRLATIYERRGDSARAREQYERVLESRSDDVTALTALQRWEEAFDANPFSLPLIRAYQRALRDRTMDVEGTSTGAQVRRALVQLARNELRGARTTLDALLQKFPANETLRMLRREAESATNVALPSTNTPSAAELRTLLGAFERLTPEQRTSLDQATYSGTVVFEQPLASGTIEGVPFRFASATQFNGTFDAAKPLRLTYRILGITKAGDADVLLLEPLRLEESR